MRVTFVTGRGGSERCLARTEVGSSASRPAAGSSVRSTERANGDAGVRRVMCQQLLHDDLDAVGLLGALTDSLR
jgi:hypothetical protein